MGTTEQVTLREYFAAKAMQSLIASGTIDTQCGVRKVWNWIFGGDRRRWNSPSASTLAKVSYEYADAMIKVNS